MLLFRVILTAVVVCVSTKVVAAESVTLKADALLITGVYVVPEEGNVTFTCNSSSGGVLLWTVDLQIQGSKVVETSSRSLNITLPNVSSPDTEVNANPASFTIHYIAPESNGSSVVCLDGTALATSSAMILVEGSPICPKIEITVSSEMLTVSLQQAGPTWLPTSYQVVVTSYNMSIGTMFNSTSSSDDPINVPSLQPDTVYNISVTPCNIVGCNESCDIQSAQTLERGSPNCPIIQTAVTSESLLVIAVQQFPTTWLPVCYIVVVTSYNMSIQIVHNSIFSNNEADSVNVTSLHFGSVYNISVTPCNIVGCNESCDIQSVQILERKSEDALKTAFDITFSVAAAGATVVVLLLVAMVTAAVVTVVCTRKRKESRRKNGRNERLYEDIDDVLVMSATLRDHAVRHLPTTRLELSNEGYQVMHSAPRSLDVREDGTHEEQISSVDKVNVQHPPSQLHGPDARSTAEHESEEHSGGMTGNDVVMEDNPAYQALMTAALPTTMESNHGGGMTSSNVVMKGSPASRNQSLEDTSLASATMESDDYI